MTTTERQYAMLDEMCAHADEQREESYDARRTGKTFRSVAWTLLTASANPHKRVLHMSASPSAARYAFRMAADMTSFIYPKVNSQTHTIELENGATIHFDYINNVEKHRGRRFNAIAKDLD